MTRYACCFTFLALALTTSAVRAESKTFTIAVAAGESDRKDVPVRMPLSLPLALAKAESVTLTDSDGKKLPAQLTAPGLLSIEPALEETVPKELHFLLPALKANASATFKATVSTDAPEKADGFSWHDTPGEFNELKLGDRPVARYMYKTFDDSSKEKRDLTYKVFHHLYDPSGQQLVTKGDGGLYPHHRGIYYGFSKVTYGKDQKCDTWHCTGGAHQSHEKFLANEAGPVLARQRVEIAWHGQNKEVFAREERELTFYRVPGGTLVEFASRLKSVGGPIKLDGDPQHAGFQFRASQRVAEKTAKQTVYLRPDGAGKPGETRNWDAKKPEVHADLPWNAMTFYLGQEPFTVAYLDRPSNPKPARFSERDYGRFGSYFVKEFDEKSPLTVAYRLWLQKGDMKEADVTALSTAFVKPVTVTVK